MKKKSSQNILQQCKRWAENDEYEKIVEALEAVAAKKRSPRMDCELAYAYFHLAEDGDRKEHKKILGLLLPCENLFADDFEWNYYAGHAFWSLEQPAPALHYLKRAHVIRPDAMHLIEDINKCKLDITMPHFALCFAKRTKIFWEEFAKIEEGLRKSRESSPDLIPAQESENKVKEILDTYFEGFAFKI